jgi:very-short-patch-repair endonuclease
MNCPTAKKPSSNNARMPYLNKCGYNVEIIWEHDIKSRLDEVIEELCQKYNFQI